MTPPNEPPNTLGNLGDPGATERDPRALLIGYLDWYRNRVTHKISGLSEAQLTTPVEPLGWSPLGLVKHLSMVERRWMRWGFAAETVLAQLPGEDAEWDTTSDSPVAILAMYHDELERSRALASEARLDTQARTGGRFPNSDQTPVLGRILFHLLQEYARHVGQLDVARELIDGTTGE